MLIYGRDLQEAPTGIGKRLETPDGTVQGLITDVVFDLDSRQVLGYEIALADGARRIVPALSPVEEKDRIMVPFKAVMAMASDLSALMAMRDPKTGAILFPLSED